MPGDTPISFQPSRPTLLLFDVDGTLIRSGGAGIRAFNGAFEAVMGWKNALGGISPAGMTDSGIAERVARSRLGRAFTAAEQAALFSRYLTDLPKSLDASEKFRVLPGIPEFLKRHHGRPRIWMGLGTGNLETGARIKLEHAGLAHFFDFGGYGSDAVERAEVLRLAAARGAALARRPLSACQVVVIGDTPNDVASGKTIGARTLAVATGPFSVKELSACAPDAAVGTFRASRSLRNFWKILEA